jgi:hypothetical protein
MEDEMDFSTINWLAVAVCVVISMLSGSAWYNPKTFFPIWWKGIGKKDDDRPGSSNMPVTWGLTILGSLVQAVAMAFVINFVSEQTGSMSLLIGAGVGFMLWFGFIAPTYLVNKLFAGHGFKVWAIEVGNHLLNFVLFGAVLGVWR